LEAAVSDLNGQTMASSEPIKALAEQNAQLAKGMEAHRVRLLWQSSTAARTATERDRRRRFPTGKRCSIPPHPSDQVAYPMYRQRFPHAPAGPWQKIVSAAMGIALLALGLTFSVVLLAVLLVAGLAVWGYLWWKTRAIRRILREGQVPTAAANGDVFEGEATVVETQAQVVPIDVRVSDRTLEKT
jgi:hypothetical protein